MCSRTLSANAPFIGSLLDFTPSIAQIYSVANKTKIAETSKYTPANVLSETRLCRSQGCRIAHVRARMQHTPPCDGAYVALECTGGRFCYLGFGRVLSPVSFLNYAPIDNPPQGLEVRGAAVLVVEVVGVLPDVEGQEGAEAVGDGVVGAGVLADGQGAGGIGLEPHPAGPEEADALGNELFLEGLEGAPLGFDLGD